MWILDVWVDSKQRFRKEAGDDCSACWGQQVKQVLDNASGSGMVLSICNAFQGGRRTGHHSILLKCVSFGAKVWLKKHCCIFSSGGNDAALKNSKIYQLVDTMFSGNIIPVVSSRTDWRLLRSWTKSWGNVTCSSSSSRPVWPHRRSRQTYQSTMFTLITLALGSRNRGGAVHSSDCNKMKKKTRHYIFCLQYHFMFVPYLM